MTDAFNPYHQWLGFPVGRIPRDFYELFRVERFESDLSLIAREADILIAEVRRIRPGPAAAKWAALLDELCAAKACLTDPQRKSVYDAQLRLERSYGGTTAGEKMPAAEADDPIAASQPGTDRRAGEAAVAQGYRSATALTSERGHATLAGPTESPQTPPSLPHLAEVFDPGKDGGQSRPAKVSARVRLNGLDILYRLAALGFVVAAVILAGILIVRRDVVRTYIGQSFAVGKSPSTQAGPSDAEGGSQRPRESSDRPAVKAVASRVDQRGLNPAGETNQSSDSTANPPASNPQTPANRLDPQEGMAAEPVKASPLTIVAAGSAPVAATPAAAGTQSTSQNSSVEPGNDQGDANDSELSGEFRAAAVEVWQALASRDLPKARERLNGLAAQVRSPLQRDCVAALQSLLLHLEEFWRGVTEATASLHSTEELTIGDTVIIVVEAGREEVVVRAAGQNRRYAVREMPTALVRAIVDQRLRKGRDTDVLLGAFLAVDPKGDQAEARRLWQSAANSGADVSLLLQALDLMSGAASSSASSPRLPVPDSEAELAKARQHVQSQISAAYAKPLSIPDKAEAARSLLEAARNAALADEVLRYVMLREAGRLAVESGEARLALQTVEELAGRYAVDPAAERRTVAQNLAQSQVPAALHQQVAAELLDAAQAALAAKDRDATQALASAAVISARKARNAGLQRQAMLLLQSVSGP